MIMRTTAESRDYTINTGSYGLLDDRVWIDVNDDADLVYWAACFQVRVAELKNMVEVIGNSVTAISKFLQAKSA